MRTIVGMFMVALGYVTLYYGVVMYRQYDSTASSATQGIPFSVLLGLHARDAIVSSAGSEVPPYAGVPFKF